MITGWGISSRYSSTKGLLNQLSVVLDVKTQKTHHSSTGLLEKLYMFAPSVRAMLISKLPLLVADYVSKFPDVEIYDDAGRKVLTNIGRTFIRQCNPTFVYYSRYLTPIVDEVVTTTPILKSQPMTLKRVANAAHKGTDTSKKMKAQ